MSCAKPKQLFDKTKIPFIIHQIWFQGFEHIPPKYAKFSETWKNQTLFTYEFWDETRIRTILNISPSWRKTFDSFPTMIQKIDFAKYLILFIYGGVYIDMDVFSVQPLEEFMKKHKNSSFLVFEHNTPCITITVNKLLGLEGKKIINNAVIFATPKHWRIQEIIRTCQYAQANWKKNWLSLQLRCLVTTGPIVFTNCIRKTNNWRKHVLPANIFEPFTTIEMVKLSNNMENSIIPRGPNEDQYDYLMNFLKSSSRMDSSTVGVHVLDLNWFKNGKENWKFRAFKKMHKVIKNTQHQPAVHAYAL